MCHKDNWYTLMSNIIALAVSVAACDARTETLTLAITFKPEVIGLSYCTCVFHVIRPFTWYHIFSEPERMCGDRANVIALVSTLAAYYTDKKFNLGHIFQTI